MEVLKVKQNLLKQVQMPNGEFYKDYQIISEHNNENKNNINRIKFDIDFREVKKIIAMLDDSGKTYFLSGLSKLGWTNIVNKNGDVVFQDAEDYLNGKVNDTTSFHKFAQLRLVVYN
jgi:hypothetical protein